MTVPTPIRPNPGDLLRPHGPDHMECRPCDLHRQATGHVLLVEGDFRAYLIAQYGEIAEAEHALGRPEYEAYARRQIARLRAENPILLAALLEQLP